jgi:aryl-alcohol dehydrogenase-like predicted oxidoreductase
VKHRTLGKSGLQVSVVGLGCNNFGFVTGMDLEASRKVIDKAIDAGINFFDTSDSYGSSEEILGEVLRGHRHKIVLATKFGSQLDPEGKKKGASRTYIFSAIESSLRRLQTDWIDLYQLHRPDPNTPMDETLRALDHLVQQGKVRHIGCSNLSATQLVEAQTIAENNHLTSFVSSQDEYSLLVRHIERELLPVVEKYGMAELPYFPLASGLLTGKYRKGQAPPKGSRLAESQRLADRYLHDTHFEKVERLEHFAGEHGHTLLELAFSWLLARPAVASVIAGATKPEQVEKNVVSANWELSSGELVEIDRITAKD